MRVKKTKSCEKRETGGRYERNKQKAKNKMALKKPKKNVKLEV